MSGNSANSANSTFISSNSNMNSTTKELLGIISGLQTDEAYKNYKFPKVFFKGGKPTKKALDFNRRLIREGKTFNYLDTTKFVERKKDKNGVVRTTIKEKKFDKRYKEKKVPLKSQKDLKTLGSVKTINSLDNKNQKTYIQTLKKQI